VTQFDPSQLQRGVIASPNTVKIAHGVIANVNKIRFYKFEIASKSRFHGKCHYVGFFLPPLYPNSLVSVGHETIMAQATFFSSSEPLESSSFDFTKAYELVDKLEDNPAISQVLHHFAVLSFEKPVVCPQGSIYIASKLDSDLSKLFFCGKD
jgi:selenocysteine-specific elongation factor